VGDVLLWRRVAGTELAPAARSVRTALGSDGHYLALCKIDLAPKTGVQSREGKPIDSVHELNNRPAQQRK
jgi:hypothetical protein